MSEKAIRVGLIGAGGNTKAFHIPGFKKQTALRLSLSPTGRGSPASGLPTSLPFRKFMTIGKRFWKTRASMPSASAHGPICMRL